MSTIKNVCMANLWPELTILRLGQWDFYRLGWCLVQQIVIQETHVICVLRRCRLEVTFKLWKPETGIMLSFTSSWPHWETGLDWSPSLPGTDTVFFLWQDNIPPPPPPFPVSLWGWGGGGGGRGILMKLKPSENTSSSPTSITPSPLLPVPNKPYGFCGR